MSTPTGPLAGIRVLDLTSVMMGPFATMTLGDMGADIVKVESPEGDTSRHAFPARHAGMGAMFMTLGRNKRSLVLDLKRQGGRDALLDLCMTADVLVTNMRPAAFARLGLGWEALHARNPHLVLCTAHGFGNDGPYAGRPAYDDMIQGASGVASLLGQVAGAPAYVPMIFVDKTVGLVVANAITAALLYRERTPGRPGQAIEVPMFETMVAFVLAEHLGGASFEPPLAAPGYSRVLTPHRRPYRTRDGYICALPHTDRQFERFFALATRPDLAADPRFAGIAKRMENVDALYALVGDIIATRTTAEWEAAFAASEIPAMRVNSLEDLLVDPHLAATGFFQTFEHASEGRIRQAGIGPRFGETPAAIRRQAPRLGEHSVEILLEAGFPQERVDALLTEAATIDGR